MDFTRQKARILELLCTNSEEKGEEHPLNTSTATTASNSIKLLDSQLRHPPAAVEPKATGGVGLGLGEEHKMRDRSPKGSLDAPIADLVGMINAIPDYVTTSSCSGRVVLYAQKERKWLYVVHSKCSLEKVSNICTQYFNTTLSNSTVQTPEQPVVPSDQPVCGDQPACGDGQSASCDRRVVILMKTEPFILHVLCRSVTAAQALLQVSRNAGFRESGISVGKKSIICAIRTTGNSMEVPITSKLSSNREHLQFLVEYANELFVNNKVRTQTFQNAVQNTLTPSDRPILPLRLKRWGHAAAVWSSTHPSIERTVVMGGYAHDALGHVARRADILVSANYANYDANNSNSNSSNNLCYWYEPVSPSSSYPPTPRVRHTLTYIGENQFVLYGGRSNPSLPISDVHVLQLSDSSHQQRCNLSSVWSMAKKRRIYTTEEKETDIILADMCAGRWSHTATYDSVKSVVWVYGGRDGKRVFGDIFCLVMSKMSKMLKMMNANEDDEEEEDCVQRIAMRNMSGRSPTGGRFSHTTTLIGRNLIVVGGCSTLSGDIIEKEMKDPSELLYIFDTDAYIWSKVNIVDSVASSNIRLRYSHTAVLVTNNVQKTTNLLVLGGVVSQSRNKNNETDSSLLEQEEEIVLYDVTKWTTMTPSLAKSAGTPVDVSRTVYPVEDLPHGTLLCRHCAVNVGGNVHSIGGGSEVLSFGACFSEPPVLKFTVGDNVISAEESKVKQPAAEQSLQLVQSESLVALDSFKPTKIPVVVTESHNVKRLKTKLASLNLLSKMLRIAKINGDRRQMAIPLCIPLPMETSTVQHVQSFMSLQHAALHADVEQTSSFYKVFSSTMFKPSKRTLKGGSSTNTGSGSGTSTGSVVGHSNNLSMRDRMVRKIATALQQALKEHNEETSLADLERIIKSNVPKKFERLGGVLMVPASTFSKKNENSSWKSLLSNLGGNEKMILFERGSVWPALANATSVDRIVRHAEIDSGIMRESRSELVYDATDIGGNGKDGKVNERRTWIDVKENGVKYGFDCEQVMYCTSNGTEKKRVGVLTNKDEIVVDLYAGIGYFTLPYLVLGQAKHVHACEINPNSVRALRKNLIANKVEDRCTVHLGDNSITAPTRLVGIADRINMGLIPSCEEAYGIALTCLKQDTGGWIHVHGNGPRLDVGYSAICCSCLFFNIFTDH